MIRYEELLRGFPEYRASAWALVAANVLPLIGVLLLDWNTFEIVALYWVENVIIGAINVLKMVTCNPNPDEVDWSALTGTESRRGVGDLPHQGAKVFLVPFFMLHYGIFCLVHGVFVFTMFGPESFGFGAFDVGRDFTAIRGDRYLVLAVAALAGSHLYSFFRNYLGRGEYRRTVVIVQMFQPYARVVVLHVAILFGAFVVVFLGSNIGVLVILIIGKTVLDLTLHLRERERSAKNPEPIMPENILEQIPRS
jgi:hypothetical protein